MDFSNGLEWASTQAKYILFIALFVVLIVTAYKRAWIAMIGVILGLAFVAIFIINPETIITLSEWLARLIGLET